MTKSRLSLLFGFLGSGKTTLAKRILTEFGADRRLALIVNEFGDVGVDGDILSGNDIDVIQLSSGCLCCTLKGSLKSAIEELAATQNVDHVVVEATGVAEPETLLESFGEPDFVARVVVGPIVTVVDAHNFHKVREMLGPFFEVQIEKADILILNKIDKADAAVVEEVKLDVLELNPNAIIRIAEHCDIDLEEVLDGPDSGVLKRWLAEHSQEHAHDHGHAHDHDHDHDHDHHHHEGLHAPAESFVVDMPGPVNRDALVALYKEAPETLWRSKGFVRLDDGKDYLVQVAMSEVDITETPPRDRHYLVFIGDKLDAVSFRGQLEAMMEGCPAR